MSFPDDLKYTKEHEWVRLSEDGTTCTVGITEFAQDELGEVVYVELPDVGAEVKKGDTFGVVESTKAASDIYSPVNGAVVAINDSLDDEPSAINSSPYSDGWLIKVQVDGEDLAGLMDSEAYGEMVS